MRRSENTHTKKKSSYISEVRRKLKTVAVRERGVGLGGGGGEHGRNDRNREITVNPS